MPVSIRSASSWIIELPSVTEKRHRVSLPRNGGTAFEIGRLKQTSTPRPGLSKILGNGKDETID